MHNAEIVAKSPTDMFGPQSIHSISARFTPALGVSRQLSNEAFKCRECHATRQTAALRAPEYETSSELCLQGQLTRCDAILAVQEVVFPTCTLLI